jgi:fatty acid desaturase
LSQKNLPKRVFNAVITMACALHSTPPPEFTSSEERTNEIMLWTILLVLLVLWLLGLIGGVGGSLIHLLLVVALVVLVIQLITGRRTVV